MIIAAAIAPPFLLQAVAIVVAAAVIAYLSSRIGLVPIVGFLIAGVIIGPHALGLVEDPALVNDAAEIGVILLLFTIGIEFSLEKLWRIKTLIFGGGGLQVTLASLAVLAVLTAFGVEWRAALFTGFLVSLSSTAIVLKLLGDRGETASPHGQVTLGLLIFQDLAVIVMVLVVPMLGGEGGSGAQIVWALAKALGLIVAVLVVARRLMPPLLERVALTCAPELFLLTVIAICLGTAWLTSIAGVSLSLGAFLAGLVVSESRFSHHAFGEIMPLQILFSATFFVSVGMLLDVGFMVHHLPLVLAAVALVVVVKTVTTASSVLALGYSAPVAAASALTLAQVGEFSFVLDRAGQAVGLSPAGLGDTGSQAFIASTVVLMVATPQLTGLGSRLAQMLKRRHVRAAAAAAAVARPDVIAETFAHLQHHVIVAGYGEAARQLTRVLHGSRVPFVITTLSPGGANEAETHGTAGATRRFRPPAHAGTRRHRPRQGGGCCRRRPGDGTADRRRGPLARADGADHCPDAVSGGCERDRARRGRPRRRGGARERGAAVRRRAAQLSDFTAGHRGPRGSDQERRLRRPARVVGRTGRGVQPGWPLLRYPHGGHSRRRTTGRSITRVADLDQ